MPQMNPMNWIFIFFISISSYWSIFSNIYFMKKMKNTFYFKSMHYNQYTIKW